MRARTPGERAVRTLESPQGGEGADPAEARGNGSTAGQGAAAAPARSSQGSRQKAGSASSNTTEKATVIRTRKCLSDLAITRSSVTLAVAMGAVGRQELGVEGVEAGKEGKALPGEKITGDTK